MSECNDHGVYEDDECTCDVGWFGKNCETTGEEMWGYDVWLAFKIIFFIFYFFLFLISLLKLRDTLYKDKISSFRKTLTRLYKSPKNFCFVILMFISVLRSLWIVIDPLRYKNSLPRLSNTHVFARAIV